MKVGGTHLFRRFGQEGRGSDFGGRGKGKGGRGVIREESTYLSVADSSCAFGLEKGVCEGVWPASKSTSCISSSRSCCLSSSSSCRRGSASTSRWSALLLSDCSCPVSFSQNIFTRMRTFWNLVGCFFSGLEAKHGSVRFSNSTELCYTNWFSGSV